jgi:hypothetical protein
MLKFKPFLITSMGIQDHFRMPQLITQPLAGEVTTIPDKAKRKL